MTPKRTVTEFVFVDGVNRGELYHRNGTWHWQRSVFEIIDYPREYNQADAVEFVRIRCSGTKAEIRQSTKGKL